MENLKRLPDDTNIEDIKKGEFCYSSTDKSKPDVGPTKDQPKKKGRAKKVALTDVVKKYIHFWPHDSEELISLPISPQKNEDGFSWIISNNNFDSPTLIPSVRIKGVWEGRLVFGVAKSFNCAALKIIPKK